MAVQSDGKLVLGGGFDNFNTNSRPYIVRLRNDGNVDVEFVPALGGVAFVGYAVAVEPDGRILMGGGMRPGLFESFVRAEPKIETAG